MPERERGETLVEVAKRQTKDEKRPTHRPSSQTTDTSTLSPMMSIARVRSRATKVELTRHNLLVLSRGRIRELEISHHPSTARGRFGRRVGDRVRMRVRRRGDFNGVAFRVARRRRGTARGSSSRTDNRDPDSEIAHSLREGIASSSGSASTLRTKSPMSLRSVPRCRRTISRSRARGRSTRNLDESRQQILLLNPQVLELELNPQLLPHHLLRFPRSPSCAPVRSKGDSRVQHGLFTVLVAHRQLLSLNLVLLRLNLDLSLSLHQHHLLLLLLLLLLMMGGESGRKGRSSSRAVDRISVGHRREVAKVPNVGRGKGDGRGGTG